MKKGSRNVISEYEILEALRQKEEDKYYTIKWAILETIAFLIATSGVLFLIYVLFFSY